MKEQVTSFQVVESTKTTLDNEDANDSEDVVDLEEFLDLKEPHKTNSSHRYKATLTATQIKPKS